MPAGAGPAMPTWFRTDALHGYAVRAVQPTGYRGGFIRSYPLSESCEGHLADRALYEERGERRKT